MYAAPPAPRGRRPSTPAPQGKGPIPGPQPLPPKPERYRYFVLWKPYGVATRVDDGEGRPSLRRLIPVPGVYPVGRLDAAGEGLLLLTDDPRFHAALTHPGSVHGRAWLVQVELEPEAGALEELRQGVPLGDRQALPAEVRSIPEPDLPKRPVPIRYRKNVPTAWLEMVVFEGWARQVRRMTAAVGHPTLRLVQWAVGPVTLEGMAPGQVRELSPEERRWAEKVTSEAPERSARRRQAPGRPHAERGRREEHGRPHAERGRREEHGRPQGERGRREEHGRPQGERGRREEHGRPQGERGRREEHGRPHGKGSGTSDRGRGPQKGPPSKGRGRPKGR